jgi:hypothetical protein
LCTNIRVKFRQMNPSTRPFFLCVNCIICKCGMGHECNGCQYCCRDRCPEVMTIFKHIIIMTISQMSAM